MLAPFALAAAGGALHFLGFVGFGIWPLALLSLACLWRALDALRARGPGAAFLAGGVFGLVAHAGGYAWLLRLVEVFLGGNLVLGAGLWLLHGLWFALGFALQALLYRAARRRGAGMALAGVPPLLLVEWLQPLLFPVHVGYALVDRLPLVQVADLGGPLLVSAGVGLVNASFAESWAWLRAERGRPLAVWATAALALAGAWSYGALRMAQLERALAEAPALRVGLVQANLGVLEKRGDPEQVHRAHLAQTRELLAAGPLDLVIWPETVYTRGIAGPWPVSGELIRDDLRLPLLFGAASVEVRDGERLRHNSALLVGADGVIRGAYHKNLLVPFAEQLPRALRRPGIAARLPHVQQFEGGRDVPALALGPWRISTPICSESAEPGLVRRMVREAKPHLLVTLANDAWFGDSQLAWIHLQVSRLRAVEHRRALVHATQSGVSAIVDPLGRVAVRGGLLTRENLRGEVRLLDAPTLYGRLGDWPGLAALLALVGAWLQALGSKRNSTMPSGTGS